MQYYTPGRHKAKAGKRMKKRLPTGSFQKEKSRF
jgi:hypothetical protein